MLYPLSYRETWVLVNICKASQIFTPSLYQKNLVGKAKNLAAGF